MHFVPIVPIESIAQLQAERERSNTTHAMSPAAVLQVYQDISIARRRLRSC